MRAVFFVSSFFTVEGDGLKPLDELKGKYGRNDHPGYFYSAGTRV